MAKRLSSNSHRRRYNWSRPHHRKQHKKQPPSHSRFRRITLNFEQQYVKNEQMNPYQSIADFDPRLQVTDNGFDLKGSKYRRILKNDLHRIMKRPNCYTKWDYILLVRTIHEISGHKHYSFRSKYPHPLIDVMYTKDHDKSLNSPLYYPTDSYDKRPLIDKLVLDQRYRFYATFIRSGIASGQRVKVLLYNVHIFPSGRLITHHIWVEYDCSLLKLGQLHTNDWILFSAKPSMYVKQVNGKDVYINGLRDISNAQRIQSNNDQTAHEMPLDKSAIIGYVMLANCHFYAQAHWFDVNDPNIVSFKNWERTHSKIKIPKKFKL